MSLELIAFLERGRVPTRDALQAAVDSLGDYDLHIDAAYGPFHRGGLVPCGLRGNESGVEIFLGSSGELSQLYPQLRSLLGERQYAMTFRWGGDMIECACASLIAAALARDFGALVYYPADDVVYTAAELVQEAATALLEIS